MPLRETIPENRDPVSYRTRMRHTHVPKLEEYGYVEFDEAADAFRRGPDYEVVAPIVEALLSNCECIPCECP